MPNAKPRKGSSNAEEESQATFTLRVLELLGDTEVVSKIKRALYPDDLVAEIKGLRAEITQLRSVVNEKDRVIAELHDRVSVLETSVDASEQYGRRANLRIQGIVESGAGAGAGEDACAKVLDVINSTMLLRPPLTDVDIERCHRLGRQTDLTRPRTMIVRFRSEKLRDTVFNARGQLKTSNKSKEPAQRVYFNEDLTKGRSLMAYETRQLRASKKIADCWTYNGHVVIKDNNNAIKRINSLEELKMY